jgi:hypothetical protein
MLKRAIITGTLFSFILNLYGCYTITSVVMNSESIENYKESEIVTIVTKDYEIYEFERSELKPKPQILDSMLTGWIKKTRPDKSYTFNEVGIPVKRIKTLFVEEKNTGVVWLMIGATVGLLAIFILTADHGNFAIDLSDFKYRGM